MKNKRVQTIYDHIMSLEKTKQLYESYGFDQFYLTDDKDISIPPIIDMILTTDTKTEQSLQYLYSQPINFEWKSSGYDFIDWIEYIDCLVDTDYCEKLRSNNVQDRVNYVLQHYLVNKLNSDDDFYVKSIKTFISTRRPKCLEQVLQIRSDTKLMTKAMSESASEGARRRNLD